MQLQESLSNASAGATGNVTVRFLKSGREVTWDPGASSLLEFAERNEISIDSGCRAGSCGSCVTAIVSGEIDYLSDPGAPPDEGCCLTCISVPKTDVVLDA